MSKLIGCLLMLIRIYINLLAYIYDHVLKGG